jgi:hypothetical protein
MSFARNSRLRSLGFRLTAWYFLVFLASTLLLAAAAEFRIRSSIRERIVDTLTTNLNRHKQTFEEQGIEGLKKLTEATENTHRLPYVRVVDHTNVTLFQSSNGELSFAATTIAVTASSQRVRPVRAQNDGSLWNMGTMPLSEGVGCNSPSATSRRKRLSATCVLGWSRCGLEPSHWDCSAASFSRTARCVRCSAWQTPRGR